MSFPRYSSTRESGFTCIAQYPSHWATLPLKRIGTIRYGIGEPPRYHDTGTPLIRATNVHAGRVLPEGLVFVDPTEIPAQRIVWLAGGDIIVVRSGAYTGDSALITEEFGECIAGFDMVLRCHSAKPEFVQYALLSKYLKEGQIDLLRMRAAQPHLNAEELGSCVIVLPPEEEQDAIAAFLDRETAKIDALIAEQQRLMELLQEKRQAVISHAVTKGLNPDAPMKPSGVEWLGNVPAHWEVIRLGRRVVLQRGVDITKDQQNEGTVPVVSSGGVASFHDRSLVSGPGVVIGRKGTAGAMYYIEQDFWPHDTTLYVKEFGGNCPRFVFHLLSSMDLASFDTGSANPTINRNLVHPVFVAWPPGEEQAQIAIAIDTTTQTLDTLASEAHRAVALLEERRSALISAAVTGQIDVRASAA